MDIRIFCQAIGRAAAIGDLYDARKERFCHVNIFTTNLPATSMETTHNQQVDARYSPSNKLTEKFNILDISDELRASILSHIIQLSGSGKYLSDEKVSEKAVRASLIYTIKTISENLNIFKADLRPIVDAEAAQHPKATHVVVGVQWGGNVFLSVEHHNSRNRKQQDIQEELKATIEKLGSWISAECNGTLNEEEIKEGFAECELKIFTDSLPNAGELPQTLDGYLSLIKQMPKLLEHSNRGNGKPLSYAMIPISTIQKHISAETLTDDLIYVLDEQTITGLENLFDEISVVKQKVYELHSDIEKRLDCYGQPALDRILKIKRKFAKTEDSLRSDLANALIQYRRHTIDDRIFQELMSNFRKDEYSINNVQSMLIKLYATVRNISLSGSIKIMPMDVRPIQTTIFESKCPRTYENICENINRKWHCGTCAQVLEYDNIGNVYCKCGEANVISITFKCNDRQHGSEYFSFNDATILSKMMEEIHSLEEVSEISKLLDQICIMKKKINDLHDVIENGLDYCEQKAMDDISEIKSRFFMSEGKFRSELAKRLRYRETDSNLLQALISKFHTDEYSTDKVQVLLDEFDLLKVKLQFLDFFKTKGVRYIGKNTSLQMTFKQYQDKDVYVFNFNMQVIKTNKKLWEANREAFIKLLDECADEENKPMWLFSENGDKISISHYENGMCISNDFVADFEKVAILELSKSSMVTPISIDKWPKKRAYLKTKCPGTCTNKCENLNHKWKCNKCLKVQEYGFNGNVYCSCGASPISSLKFKCNDPQHGYSYMQFIEPEILLKMVAELKPLREYKEINILLLGETGVGKSTWINGIYNYLAYDTLENAIGNETKYLIPTNFTMMDDDFNERVITMGADENGVSIPGQSATQLPKSYVFNYEDACIRLIDTPGIGDTRGVKQDKENFQNILSHLSNLEYIHGICILLKPNNARLNVMFQFCIKELLTHLHKDCSKNIVFVFTNARNTFYHPGNTMPALKGLLNKNKDVEIVLAKDTVYCVDNESIRFLAASKKGKTFDETEIKNYSESWKKSVAENTRLIDHIRSLEAYSTKQTMSINESRRLILALTEPLAEIAKNIHENIKLSENKKTEICDLDCTTKNLREKLNIPVSDLEVVNLDYPRTVCTSSKCVAFVKVGEVVKTIYKQWCHERCYLKGVNANCYPDPAVKSCKALFFPHCCRICGCSWEKHMHISYECKSVITQVVEKNVEMLLNDKNSSMDALQVFINQVEDRIQQLNDEQTKITKTASEFGNFLKENATTPYNDVMQRYLEHCIKREKDQVAIGGNRDALTALQKMLEEYRQQVTILEKAMETNEQTKKLNSEDISKRMEELFKLPLNGEALKTLMKCELDAKNRSFKHNEVYVHTPKN